MSLLGLPLSIQQDIIFDVYNSGRLPRRDTHPDALLIAKALVQPVRRALLRRLKLQTRAKAQSLVDLLAVEPGLGAHCRAIVVSPFGKIQPGEGVTVEQLNAILMTVTRLDSISMGLGANIIGGLSLRALERLAAARPQTVDLASSDGLDTPEVWALLGALGYALELVELVDVSGLATARSGPVERIGIDAFRLRLMGMTPADESVIIRACRPVMLFCEGGDATLSQLPDLVCSGIGYLDLMFSEDVSGHQLRRFANLDHLSLPPYQDSDIVDGLPLSLTSLEINHGDIIEQLVERLPNRTFLPKLKRVLARLNDDNVDLYDSDGDAAAANRDERRVFEHDLVPVCEARGIKASMF